MATQTKASKKTAAGRQASSGFTTEERAAMKERAQEMKAEARRTSKADAEATVLAKIADMPEPDRSMAARVHTIITETAPVLSPKLWYGMPAYANDGTIVCFFQDANKFKARYATLGFNDAAHLDDGTMWPTSFALKEITPASEAMIGELVKKAVS